MDWLLEASAELRKTEKKVLRTWLTELNYLEPVGFFFNYGKKQLTLYATRPGLLIGRAGVNIDKLKKALTDEFVGEWTIHFEEIRGGFVIGEEQ